MTVRRRDELEPADVEISLFGCVSNALRRADQDRVDEPELMGLDRAVKRDIVAGVRDGDFNRRLLLRGGDQTLVFFVANLFVRWGLASHVRSPFRLSTSPS